MYVREWVAILKSFYLTVSQGLTDIVQRHEPGCPAIRTASQMSILQMVQLRHYIMV